MEKAKQCKHCPWRVDTDPTEIPNGYCKTKHAALENTIASEAALSAGPLRLMACHESPVGSERPCVGWLHNQLTVGNNLGLRLAVITRHVSGDYELIGKQHPDFKSTLKRAKRAKPRREATKAP